MDEKRSGSIPDCLRHDCGTRAHRLSPESEAGTFSSIYNSSEFFFFPCCSCFRVSQFSVFQSSLPFTFWEDKKGKHFLGFVKVTVFCWFFLAAESTRTCRFGCVAAAEGTAGYIYIILIDCSQVIINHQTVSETD